MKKRIRISINCQLDFLQTEVTYPDGRCLTDKLWRVANSDPERELAIMKAKAQCFDLLWQYTELGQEAYIHPYLN
jgi:hypothetical protein